MTSVDQCEEFSAFCQQMYGSNNGEGECLNSKMVGDSEQGGIIVVVLKGNPMFETYYYCPISSGTNSNTEVVCLMFVVASGCFILSSVYVIQLHNFILCKRGATFSLEP